MLFAYWVRVRLTGREHEGILWDDGNDLYLDSGDGEQVYNFVKTHQTVPLILCILLSVKYILKK